MEAQPLPEPKMQSVHMPELQRLSLGDRIAALHGQLRLILPQVDRMACALYDPEMDLLKTFVNSTMDGEPLKAYQYRLSDSESLSRLARSGDTRVIDDIPQQLLGDAPHTEWVRGMGYRSSYTAPLFHQGVFHGFLFLDSRQPGVFTPEAVSRLDVFVNLVMLIVSHEITAIQTLVGTIRVARDFANLRDTETGTHLDRMSRYARLIARNLSSAHGLNDEFVEQVFLFSPLHDIGKVGIPDAILLKPGRFTPEEREIMMGHVDLGCEMIERLVQDFNLATVAGIDVLRNLVAGHHELLDGSGYPRGLAGDAIPLEARIVAVADIFDALTSKRVYKASWGVDEALANLREMAAAGKLDPACVGALESGRREVEEIIRRFDEASLG